MNVNVIFNFLLILNSALNFFSSILLYGGNLYERLLSKLNNSVLKSWRKWKTLASLRRPFACSNSIIHAELISIHGVKSLLVHFSLPLNLSAFTLISDDVRLMMCNEHTIIHSALRIKTHRLLVVYSLRAELKAGWAVFSPSFEEKLCYLGIRTRVRAKPGLLSWDIFYVTSTWERQEKSKLQQ